jgi:hypothetical protein
VAAATQSQAMNAIVFLNKQVLEIDSGSFHAVRANAVALVAHGAQPPGDVEGDG